MAEGACRMRGVVGFALTYDAESVLLIRKQRPESQAGKLNGVGGKIERGESPVDAMVREFQEESGVGTSAADWELFAVLTSPEWEVSFFRASLPRETLEDAVMAPPLTHERLECWDIDRLPSQSTTRNMRWLLPLCLDTSRYVLPLRFYETKSSPQTTCVELKITVTLQPWTTDGSGSWVAFWSLEGDVSSLPVVSTTFDQRRRRAADAWQSSNGTWCFTAYDPFTAATCFQEGLSNVDAAKVAASAALERRSFVQRSAHVMA